MTEASIAILGSPKAITAAHAQNPTLCTQAKDGHKMVVTITKSPQDHENELTYQLDRFGNNLRSRVLRTPYKSVAVKNPVRTPISPVPALAIGPVYSVWDIEGTITAKAPAKARTAAIPIGSLAGLSQSPTVYEAKLFERNKKCSERTMAANAVDQ